MFAKYWQPILAEFSVSIPLENVRNGGLGGMELEPWSIKSVDKIWDTFFTLKTKLPQEYVNDKSNFS